MARNRSRGSLTSPPKGLNTISANSAASSVRYSANRYSSRRSASSAASGRTGLRVKAGPGGGVASSIGAPAQASVPICGVEGNIEPSLSPASQEKGWSRTSRRELGRKPFSRSREKVPEEPAPAKAGGG